MRTYRFSLDPGSKKHRCPNCRQLTFVRYVDMEKDDYLPHHVGRCDRVKKCGHHYPPRLYFEDNNIPFNKKGSKPKTPPRQKSTLHIPVDQFKQSLSDYEKNNFVKYLSTIFGDEVTSQLIIRYFIGTSGHQFQHNDFVGYKAELGATIFWQIDIAGKIRTGKIMLYDPLSGKRIKEPFSHINWFHNTLKKTDHELRQCLFGEHLLRIDANKPVAIVESEKTAIIASVYLPKYIWLASGSLQGLNPEKFKVLSGRKVVLFPDIGAFQDWTDKVLALSSICHISVSDLLERKATEEERKGGLDIADYLVRYDLDTFLESKPIMTDPVSQQATSEYDLSDITAELNYPENILDLTISDKTFTCPNIKFEPWDITELVQFYTSATLPPSPISIDPFTMITDVSKFVSSHIETIEVHNGNPTFLPYYERLSQLKAILTKTE